MVARARRRRVGQGLLQEGRALGEATDQRVRVAEVSGGNVEENRHRRAPAQLDCPLEWRDGLLDLAATQAHESDSSMGMDEAGRILEVTRFPDRLLAACHRLGELAQL